MISRLTYARLDAKFPRSNTIANNQHYMVRYLDNPGNSLKDKSVAVRYIIDNPDLFTPRPDDTGDPVNDEIARKLNGNRCEKDFVERIRKEYGPILADRSSGRHAS